MSKTEISKKHKHELDDRGAPILDWGRRSSVIFEGRVCDWGVRIEKQRDGVLALRLKPAESVMVLQYKDVPVEEVKDAAPVIADYLDAGTRAVVQALFDVLNERHSAIGDRFGPIGEVHDD